MNSATEPEFVNVEGAQELIQSNQFRQAMYPGGPEHVFLNVYGAHESSPRNEFRQPM
jgi:hypothetical protein